MTTCDHKKENGSRSPQKPHKTVEENWFITPNHHEQASRNGTDNQMPLLFPSPKITPSASLYGPALRQRLRDTACRCVVYMLPATCHARMIPSVYLIIQVDTSAKQNEPSRWRSTAVHGGYNQRLSKAVVFCQYTKKWKNLNVYRTGRPRKLKLNDSS